MVENGRRVLNSKLAPLNPLCDARAGPRCRWDGGEGGQAEEARVLQYLADEFPPI